MCPVGHFAAETGAAGCTPCALGQFQDQDGQVSCKPCSIGRHQGGMGATDCVDCPSGRYQRKTRQTSCAQLAATRSNILLHSGQAKVWGTFGKATYIWEEAICNMRADCEIPRKRSNLARRGRV